MNYILQYNEALRRGEIPACKRVKAVYNRLACAVADGAVQDDTFLPLLYELDSRADHARGEPAAEG